MVCVHNNSHFTDSYLNPSSTSTTSKRQRSCRFSGVPRNAREHDRKLETSVCGSHSTPQTRTSHKPLPHDPSCLVNRSLSQRSCLTAHSSASLCSVPKPKRRRVQTPTPHKRSQSHRRLDAPRAAQSTGGPRCGYLRIRIVAGSEAAVYRSDSSRRRQISLHAPIFVNIWRRCCTGFAWCCFRVKVPRQGERSEGGSEKAAWSWGGTLEGAVVVWASARCGVPKREGTVAAQGRGSGRVCGKG